MEKRKFPAIPFFSSEREIKKIKIILFEKTCDDFSGYYFDCSIHELR